MIAVPFVWMAFNSGSATDPIYIGIVVGVIFLFAVIIGTFMMAAKHVQQSVWRVAIEQDYLVINTLSEERRIAWNTIKNFEKQAAGEGKSFYVLTFANNEKLNIDSSIDKTGKLFDQIREKSNLPWFKRHTMPMFLQVQTIVGLPMVLMFFGWIISYGHPSWLCGIAAFSMFYILFMCMFLALWCETSEDGLKIKTVLTYCETSWKNVNTMRLSSYIKTPQGCIFLSGWMPDLDVFKETIRTQVANQKNLQWADDSNAAKLNKGSNNSDSLVLLLAVISLVSPLQVCGYVAPVAVIIGLFDFWLGKSNLLRFGACLLLSVPAVVATYTVSDMVLPNSPAVARLIEANTPSFDLTKYVQLAEPVNAFGYEINPPAVIDDSSAVTTESGQLRKWHGKNLFGGPHGITFLVADEHRTGDEGKERYEWSHPPGLSNIERVGSSKQEFGGLTFTVNQFKATSSEHQISGFDYIAEDNKLMVALRSYDTRETDARARAEAVMKTFRKVSDSGIPRHTPAPAVIKNAVDAKSPPVSVKKKNTHHQRKTHSK